MPALSFLGTDEESWIDPREIRRVGLRIRSVRLREQRLSTDQGRKNDCRDAGESAHGIPHPNGSLMTVQQRWQGIEKLCQLAAEAQVRARVPPCKVSEG